MIRFVFGLIFLHITLFIYGQRIEFEYLGLKDGLSQVSVTSITQDNIGRIWIGTRDGINVYDGDQIKTFRPVKGDTTSLLDHWVKSLQMIGDQLWVISNKGISCLNLQTLKFKRFPFDGIHTVAAFDGRILLGTTEGLFELDTARGDFLFREDIFNASTSVRNLFVDPTGLLRICSDEGYYKYNMIQEITSKITGGKVTAAFTDSRKQTWVGTDGDGLILLNRQDEVIRVFRHQEDSHSIVNDIIRDIEEDTQGNILIGTFLGLSIINPRSFEITNYQQNEDLQKSLSHNSIYCIFRDQQGTMWLGTYFGAISFYNPDYHVYKSYPVGKNMTMGVNYHVVGEMLEDSENNLWIATEGGGLDYLDRKKQVFSHYKHTEGQPGISHNNIRSLHLANKDHLLIGTHLGGLNILNVKTGKFEVFTHSDEDPNSIPSNIINDIFPFGDAFLLGTHQGVFKLDLETRSFSPFIEDEAIQAEIEDAVFCLFEDSFGNIWIGTERNGLFKYNPKTGRLKRYFHKEGSGSIRSNSISCIFEDHQFRLWIGTLGSGLNQYLPKEDDFLNYSSTTHQFPSDFIYGLVESRYGNLWVSTSKGLVLLDVEQNRSYSYTLNNGFPLEELNHGGLYLTSDGEIFVGGINGLISFWEKDLLKKTTGYSVLFTSLFVNNREVRPGDETGLLDKDLPFTESITLEPQQNIITVHYSSNNYVPSIRDRYEYQLENFDREWIKAGDKTSVTYTNLDPGKYKLKIRILSMIDDSVIDTKVMNIIVNPPLYKTWFAYLFYVILLIGLVLWFNHMYLSRVRLEDNLKAEKSEKDQIQKLNESKLRFFTNISHEFRTPLTLITASLESIMEDNKTSTGNYKKLVTINNNAVRLNNLITELLDFRKLEQGFLQLGIMECSLPAFIEEIFESFVEYAYHRQIDYSIRNLPNSMKLWFDKPQMEKVFYNLISNAFKAVDDHQGIITIDFKEYKGHIDIIVRDNGPGLAEREIGKIFDRYYQIDRIKGKLKGQGSGIGLALSLGIVKEHKGDLLVESTEGKGSSFIVRLKKGNKHFSADQLANASVGQSRTEALYIPVEEEIEEYEHARVSDSSPLLLIVEDNSEARRLLKNIFEPFYRVIDAKDGFEGLKMAINRQPDVIISDVMMPNMSGTQMCAKLKRNINTSHIPIILLTARTSIEYKIEGIETGADDYITKPFNTKLLRARVRNLILNRLHLQQKFKSDPKAEINDVAPNPMDQKILREATETIERFIDDTEFDVNIFAREMGLGRTRLFSKIKGVTGLTPNEFILSIRLKNAARLLTTQSELNVSEIAYAVGFSTPRYFSRCFREHFGVSPSKYVITPSPEDKGPQ